MAVKEGDKVKVEYTGKLEDGTVFDQSKAEPLEFEMGAKQLIPGFEKAVMGMNLNESKTITISKEDAYGDARPELRKEVPKKVLPAEKEPVVGMHIAVKIPTGQTIPGKIAEINKDSVVIDFNHPLAGKKLIFEIKVVGIN